MKSFYKSCNHFLRPKRSLKNISKLWLLHFYLSKSGQNMYKSYFTLNHSQMLTYAISRPETERIEREWIYFVRVDLIPSIRIEDLRIFIKLFFKMVRNDACCNLCPFFNWNVLKEVIFCCLSNKWCYSGWIKSERLLLAIFHVLHLFEFLIWYVLNITFKNLLNLFSYFQFNIPMF
jgi:hypothetical protein